MRALVAKLYQRVSNFTIAAVLAVSSLTALTPFILSQVVGAVTYGDVVVAPSDMKGWSRSGTGVSNFSDSQAKLGYGSYKFLTDTNGQKHLINSSLSNGLKLSEIVSLGYSAYVEAREGAVAPLIRIDTKIAGKNSTLVWEPANATGGQPVGEWKDWNPLTQGKWWATKPSPIGSYPVGIFTNQDTYKTWSDIIELYGNSTVRANGVYLSAGQGTNIGTNGAPWRGFVGYVDNFVLNGTSYDFELNAPDTTPPAAPTNLRRVAANGDVIACGATIKNQVVTPTWNKSVDTDVAYYEYSSFNPPTGTPGLVEVNLGDVDHFNTNGWVSTTEGTGKFAVRAVDTSGNKSAWAECAVTYDKTAPLAPTLLSPSNGAVVNGASVTQSWNASDSSHVDYYIYESYNDSGASDLRWSQNVNGTSKTADNVADATYWWRVKAVDYAGNESSWSELWKLTIDSTAPYVEINNPTGVLYDSSVEVRGTATDNNLRHYWFKVTRDGVHVAGGTVISSGITNKLLYTASADGLYVVTLAARDTAGGGADTGNRGGDVTHTFRIDTTAPTIPVIQNPIDGTYFTTGNILNKWSPATDTNGSGVKGYQVAYRYDDGHTFGGSTCPGLEIGGLAVSGCRDESGTQRNHTPSSGEQGGVTVWVRAQDNAGNWSDWSVPAHYYYDATAPVITVNGGDETVELGSTYVDAGATAADNVDGDVTVSVDNPVDSNVVGVYTVTYNATDNAGHTSTATRTVSVVDTAAPNVTINALTTTSTTPTLTGDVDADAVSVVVTINGVDYPAVINGDGTWSLTLTSPIATGVYTVTVVAKDAYDNTGTAGATLTVQTVVIEENDPDTDDDDETAPQVIVTPIDPEDEGALGEQDDRTGEDGEGVAAAQDDKTNGDSDKSGFAGLAWYWWALIIAGIVGAGWWIIAAVRRRKEEN